MEEWQEKDRHQQSALRSKQETIDKLSDTVDSLKQQLSAESNRCNQSETICACVS